MQIEPLEYGKFYHIYNRGVNSCDIFRDEDDYLRFLNLYDKYIDSIADTFAWALMGNHFHLLVAIKEEADIKTLYELNQATASASATPSVVANPDGGEGCDGGKGCDSGKVSRSEGSWQTRKPFPSNQLSHLFNAYAQYFNKKYERHGTLLERPFKRKQIDSDNYFQQLVLYIHNNPVHHGFCQDAIEYPWTSYQKCLSETASNLKRTEVLKWFNDLENFKSMHTQTVDVMNLDTWLSIN